MHVLNLLYIGSKSSYLYAQQTGFCQEQKAGTHIVSKDHLIHKDLFSFTICLSRQARPLQHWLNGSYQPPESAMDKSVNSRLLHTGFKLLFANFFNLTMACAHFSPWSQPKEWTFKETYLAKPAHSLLFMHNSTLNEHSPTMTQTAFSLDVLHSIFLQSIKDAEIRSLSHIQQRYILT